MTDVGTEATESRERRFLRGNLDPATTAVLTMELQNGIVAGEALFPNLVDEVARLGVIGTASRVTAMAREVGARVVHCTKVTRPDGAGQKVNCKVFALSEKMRREQGRDSTQIGTRGADVVDGVSEPDDFFVPRLSGMTPFTSTSLDQLLRNLGIQTVVVMGVSVNLGILGTSLTALDLGYQVVLVRDAVAGVPPEYAQQVMEQTLSLITTVVTSEDIAVVWGKA